ncbi:MAG: FecR family protein [Flavisolibacter sp.]
MSQPKESSRVIQLDQNQFHSPQPHITERPWMKSLIFGLTIILCIVSAAVFIGRNSKKPVDWIFVNAIEVGKKVQLPDGSRILLGKGSSIAYQSSYGKMQRLVQFKGEAYFQVQYNPSQPFFVHAINQIIADTSTSFFIRSTDSSEEVIVTSGRVKIENNAHKGEFLMIGQGQKAEVAKGKLIHTDTLKAKQPAWKNEQLVFNGTPLKQVAVDIHSYYGIPVHMAPEVPADSIFVTEEFENAPLSLILQTIGAKTGLWIREVSDTVQISKIPHRLIESSAPAPLKKKKKNWIKRFFSKKASGQTKAA